MELTIGIKKALDGEGVLFLGSGFSVGGKNAMGEPMKVGADLAEAVCKDHGIKESKDLTIAAQRYLDDITCSNSLRDLIAFLRKEVFCTEASDSQRLIASVPWHRIYTTNYDNSFEVASNDLGLLRKSITITNSRFSSGNLLEQAIVHINGSVLKLDEKSFYDEFKISDEDYTKEGLLQSAWCSMFDNDLKTAEVVFFVGYSLQYDQELVRHLANLKIQDKCIFIDIKSNDEDKEYRISRYGKLCTIGAEGFAEEIKNIKNDYTPRTKKRKLNGFEKREISQYYSEQRFSSQEVIRLFINGILDRAYMNQQGYCISREDIIKDVQSRLEDKDIIVFQSKLGNGKTVLLESIANFCTDKYNVFFVKNTETMQEDLNIIQGYSDKPNMIIIDDYGYYTDLIKELGTDFPDNMKILMSSRSSININLYQDLFDIYNFQKDRTDLIDIDEISDRDVVDLIKVLDSNRLWGKYDRESSNRKKHILSKKYGKNLSNIFYLLLDSEAIKKRVENLLSIIKEKKGLFDYIIAQSINSICNLKFTYSEIREYTGISDRLIRSYEVDQNVREILSFSENALVLNSSIFAQYLVREANMKDQLLAMLEKMYRCCSKNDSAYGRYYQKRRNMVNRSNIILLLNGKDGNTTKADEEHILGYYDKIKNLPTASNNPYFWLQFGITALNIEEYDMATLYFDNAMANAEKMTNFDTYQITTHRARLLLCKEMARNTNNPSSALNVFKEANELLINNRNKGEKMRYVLRQAYLFYDYLQQYRRLWSEEEVENFRKEAIKLMDRFYSYFSDVNMGQIPSEVTHAYIKYKEIFTKTGYELKFRELDMLYHSRT